MHLIRKYFPDLDTCQLRQFEKLLEIVPALNEKVNIISRRDVEHLEERHILHSLSIAKKISFNAGTSVIDVGTGGGFPGIPLAIMFPDAHFTLADSIGKKIRLVQEAAGALDLKNVEAIHGRMENLEQTADFVVSRAVSSFLQLHLWCDRLIRPGKRNSMPNGMIALKGGDLDSELEPFDKRVELFSISNWFDESFFCTKKIVYLKK